MSWFFGSKKSNSRQDLYVKEVDGFSLVSNTSDVTSVAPYPLYPTINPLRKPERPPPPYLPSSYFPPQHGSYSAPPYPLSVPPAYQTSAHTSPPSQHPLDLIPFKLSSALDSTSSPTTKYQLNSIKKQLDEINEEINSGAFRYDFKLEKSVLQEERLSSREH